MRAPPTQISFRRCDESTGTCLHVSGELDRATAPSLQDCLDRLRDDERNVRLDLSGLVFIDAAGGRVIAGALAEAREDHWLQLAPGVSDPVRHMLRLVDLDGLVAAA